MSKLREQILAELEKEAADWAAKEYRKRQEIVRQEVEKQVAYAQEHDGYHGASTVRAYHERNMALAMSELRREVEFEADQWIIRELDKRLEKAGKKADAGTRGPASAKTAAAGKRGDEKKKAKAKTGSKAKSKPSTKTKKKT